MLTDKLLNRYSFNLPNKCMVVIWGHVMGREHNRIIAKCYETLHTELMKLLENLDSRQNSERVESGWSSVWQLVPVS